MEVIVHFTYRSPEVFRGVKNYFNMGGELVLEFEDGSLRRIPRSTLQDYEVREVRPYNRFEPRD